MSATGDELDKVAPALKEGLPERYRQFSESDGENLTGQVNWYDGQPRPEESQMLQALGHEPGEWKIVRFKHSRWEQKPGVWLNALGIWGVRREASDPDIIQADFADIMKSVGKWRPKAPARFRLIGTGPDADFVHQVTDWQLGKGEGGGTPETINRIKASLDGGLVQLSNMRLLGYRIPRVNIVGTGDLAEQCGGFYGMQAFQADLDMRQQRRLAFELMMLHIREYARVATEVRITGAGGNHGESRNGDGKAFTTFADNDDLLILDWCKSVVEAAGYDNVVVELPDVDPLIHVIEMQGVGMVINHGHQMHKGTNAQAKALEWWKAQALSSSRIRDAKILMTGHNHSFSVSEYSVEGRTAIQGPAQDGGSSWFTGSSGLSAPTGAVTLLVGDQLGVRGWDQIRVV